MCNFEITISLKGNSLNRVEEYKVLTKQKIQKTIASGDNGVEETLLPIPNRKVKLYSVNGTARETVWESRTLLGNVARQLSRQSRGLKILVSLVRFLVEPPDMAPQPSGKAEVCKTFIPQFKSGWRLQEKPTSNLVGFFVIKFYKNF